MKGRWPEIGRIAAVIGLFLLALSGVRALAATTERLVVDPHTGLALGGVDPVAYFTDGQMLKGSPEFELTAQGAVWRFCNEDNRTFFAAAPQIYAPQFGGYDPVDVARGVAVAGQPRLWLIHGQRLYLFSREDNRDAFAAAPDTVVRGALASWPALRETLAR
ncbi:MAG: YHS domain-containing (seleno)protein [Pseudomonadota bacterium]